MTNAPEVSVLLPVHDAVEPTHLAAALDSIGAQTAKPGEVVLVEDGPLTPAQHDVIEAFDAIPLVRVTLKQNSGAGVANQAGLARARGTWIAKADADDILVPHRLEAQLTALAESGADVCGAAMWEFEDDPGRPVRLRSNPLTHVDIARRMRLNNPINHPTVIYRRELALQVGGYPDLRLMQDYDLFARMLVGGAVMLNLPEPLVLFRSGEAMRRRRAGADLLRRELDLQRRLRKYGVVGRLGATRNLLVRGTFRLLPTRLLRVAYDQVLSRRVRRDDGGTAGEDA